MVQLRRQFAEKTDEREVNRGSKGFLASSIDSRHGLHVSDGLVFIAKVVQVYYESKR